MPLLDEGLSQLGLDVETHLKAQLIEFIDLLVKWNRVYNLTSVKGRDQMIVRHLLDSLVLVHFIRRYLTPQSQATPKKRIIDVGCGAGLPGLPLAIVFPQYDFVLLDSNSKKTRFIVQVVSELALKNITIESCRSQDFHPEQQFDCIVSRALSSVSDIVAMTAHLCAQNGLFLLMKGTNPKQELETLTDEVIVRFVERVDIPKLDAQRHVVGLQARS